MKPLNLTPKIKMHCKQIISDIKFNNQTVCQFTAHTVVA